MKTAIGAALLSLAIGTGSVLAQTAPPAPASTPAAPAKMMPDDKKAISKSCTDQADAKGLHGKERKKFRSECKHHGSKAQ